MGEAWQLDLDIVLWVQNSRTPILASLLLPLDWMGATAFYMVLLPLLYWCVDANLGRRVTLVFLAAAWANGWLKAVFDRPRPPDVSALVEPVVAASGPGIPSGHAMMATVLWALVAIGLKRRWFTILSACIIVLMGLSRVVHGVHFPSDVLAGWGVGAAIVLAVVRLERPVTAWLEQRSTAERAAIALAVVLALLLICPVVTPLGKRSSYAPTVTAAGAFAGAALGMALERARLRFVVDGALLRRGGRYLVGVLSVAVIHFGFSLLARQVAAEPGWLEAVIRFARYGIVGAWLAVGAPWLLWLVGLLERDAEGQIFPYQGNWDR